MNKYKKSNLSCRNRGITCPGWRYGGTHYRMLRDYLSRLEWPPKADSVARTGFTYFELAIDYEVTSGLDLPYSNKDREAGVQTLSERARVLRVMMRELSRQAQAPLYAGVDADHVHCLAPLGISKSAGITRRPVLLGTAETEQVVKVFEGMKHMGARLLPCSNYRRYRSGSGSPNDRVPRNSQ